VRPYKRLVDRDTGAVVVEDLEVADGFWSRLWGLQFRAALPPAAGLLLTPCASLHTFWMRFAIDVVMLDRGGVALAVRRGVRPWRVVLAARGTHSVLEVPCGCAVRPGAALQVQNKA
jgi:uncharacterized protein